MTNDIDTPGVVIVTHGEITAGEREYATTKLEHLMRFAESPVLFRRIELSRYTDPARSFECAAKAEIDVNGQIVRAHADGAIMTEAVDRLEARLRARLERAQEAPVDRRLRFRGDDAHEWRHGQASPPRPDFFPRAAEEREIVRRKTFACRPLAPDEAIDEMELLDHDFYLFVNLETGEDNVVSRSEGGYVLHEPAAECSLQGCVEHVVRSEIRPRVMPLDEARGVLDATERPWEFFVDPRDRRGCVLYRRYDGHYGLIGPADREPAVSGSE